MRLQLVFAVLLLAVAGCATARGDGSRGFESPFDFGLGMATRAATTPGARAPFPTLEELGEKARLGLGGGTRPVINTTLGVVEGFTHDGVDIFLGVPFAAPPTGSNRWRPPQPAATWSGVRDASKLGHVCPQFPVLGHALLGREDCLYLNLYIPHTAYNTKQAKADGNGGLPIMFWIYGGGYTIGDSNEFGLYDGRNLAKKNDVIVVTHNYRLGALGFMALDALAKENSEGTTGNYGVQDQRQAMQWVQANADRFGGDKSRMTIFGESAGAFSVCWHLGSPASNGLFSSAIMESGTCDSPDFFQPFDGAKAFAGAYAKQIGCDPAQFPSGAALLQCLRALPSNKLLTKCKTQPYGSHVNPLMPWGPAVDGTDAGLPATPLAMLRSGRGNPVPLIAGSNNNEGSIFVPTVSGLVPGVHFPLNEHGMNLTLLHFFNQTSAETVMSLYPKEDYKSVDARMGTILRDFFFVCSTRRVTLALAARGVPSRTYRFVFKTGWIGSNILGDYHSAELPFVFDNQWPAIVHAFSKRDAEMSNTFTTAWTSFAKSAGNNTGSVDWPTMQVGAEKTLVMDVPTSIQDDFLVDRCNVWDTIAELPWVV